MCDGTAAMRCQARDLEKMMRSFEAKKVDHSTLNRIVLKSAPEGCVAKTLATQVVG